MVRDDVGTEQPEAGAGMDTVTDLSAALAASRQREAVLQGQVAALAIANTRLSEELQEANSQFGVASKHKSEFLANMSHELRTPLNAVIGYSEMLQEEAEEAGAEAFLPDLRKINAAGKHLLGLINDILDLSKIEAGRMDLHLERFEVGAMVRDVAAIIQPLMEKNGNTLVVSCPDDAGMMHADLTKVRQALFNLLSNASKFTESGRIELRVARDQRARRSDRRHLPPAPLTSRLVTFAVSDTGIGMTEEQLGRISRRSRRPIARRAGSTAGPASGW